MERLDYEDKYLHLVRNVLPKTAHVRKYQLFGNRTNFESIALDNVVGVEWEELAKPIYKNISLAQLKLVIFELEEMNKNVAVYLKAQDRSKKMRLDVAKQQAVILNQELEQKRLERESYIISTFKSITQGNILLL